MPAAAASRQSTAGAPGASPAPIDADNRTSPMPPTIVDTVSLKDQSWHFVVKASAKMN